ncbi:MAG: FKBP-type peptidyl-prolyl cis-trans isomerase [Betaproteobacteria bacterium]|nr:FKBP-type peptidyl-prolyl cis-trans isomerase [Betaproteobacteria bacterium]
MARILKSLIAPSLGVIFALAMVAVSAFAADALRKTDTVVGKGKEAVAGKTVEVHYTGWLYEVASPKQRGQQFDSSVGRGPFSFQLGAGRVIKGWDEGVAGMKVGGKRTLVIPPELAYGKRGAGGVISPGATLVFDVELLDVK